MLTGNHRLSGDLETGYLLTSFTGDSASYEEPEWVPRINEAAGVRMFGLGVTSVPGVEPVSSWSGMSRLPTPARSVLGLVRAIMLFSLFSPHR
jgi:hypothetical protein